MMAVLRPSDAKETPQYLLSAREDVMKDLAKSDRDKKGFGHAAHNHVQSFLNIDLFFD